MTAEENLQRFNDSFERVMSDSDRFLEQFYAYFLAADPDVQAMFGEDGLRRAQEMLIDSLQYMVAFAGGAAPSAYLVRVARGHAKVPAHYFELWIEALLRAASEHDPKWSAQTERAWRAMLAPGVQFMMSGR